MPDGKYQEKESKKKGKKEECKEYSRSKVDTNKYGWIHVQERESVRNSQQ